MRPKPLAQYTNGCWNINKERYALGDALIKRVEKLTPGELCGAPSYGQAGAVRLTVKLVQSALAGARHVRLALHQHVSHATDVVETRENLAIAVDKAQTLVLDAELLAKVNDECLQPAQVVTGNARKEVVDGLELQTAVHKVHPGGAVDVHGGAELALGKGLAVAQVGGGHAPVGEGDLDVQRHGHDVRDEDKGDAEGPGGQGAPDEAVAVEEPVGGHEEHLDGTRPGGGTEIGGTRREEV